jgi:hypothetical protein
MFEDPTEDPLEDLGIVRTDWWLASLGNAMVWARMRVYDTGIADVLSSDGGLIRYADELEARAALMDADYQSLEGMDDDDALPFGKLLEELQPPEADSDSDEDLVPLLIELVNANRNPGSYNL